MSLKTIARLAVGLMLAAMAACQQARAPYTRSFPASGTVERIAADRRYAVIAHQEIPGFMSAMTMEFMVKDPAALTGISVGDDVTFTVEQTPESVYIVGIRASHEKTPADLSAGQTLSSSQITQSVASDGVRPMD